MTNRLGLNWKVDGFVDEQRYYCSETPIDLENLPSTKAVLAGDVRTYVDTDIEIGKTYYVRIGSVKNGVEKISDEKLILAGQAWTPSNLTNPAKLWISSDSVLVDASNRISQVNDLSGNNYNVAQSSNANKPVLINNSIQFDGSNDYLTANTGLDVFRNINKAWMVGVFSKKILDTSDAERPIIVFANNAQSYRVGLNIGQTYANKNIMFFGGRRLDSEAYSGVSMPNGIIAGHVYIAVGCIDYSTNTTQLYVDGMLVGENTNSFTATGNTSDTASSRIRVGSNVVPSPTTFGDIDISAILAGNTQLSTEDRQKLEGWVAHKYGLTDNLPSGHPYKALVPVL